jgi:tetratricopeptide (TPR) repeat protein
MRKQSRLFQFQAGLILLLIIIGIGQMQAATAHPYQIKGMEEYKQEQAQWREIIKRDPKNPEPYLQLGASLSAEASEGYWCATAEIAVYREAIAVVPPNAKLHFRLGTALMGEPAVNCDEQDPAVIQTNNQEGLAHLRKAIAIASETASAEALYDAADRLTQVESKVKPSGR